MLYPRRPLNPMRPDSPRGISPFETYECGRCKQMGRPKMTIFYKLSLAVSSVFFGAAIYVLPWWGLYYRRPGKELAIFMAILVIGGLIFSRNAYRCRKCDGILW